jgi:hypothetical protein
MSYCRLIAISAFLVAATVFSAGANAQKPESRYIKFDLDACETIKQDEESQSITLWCESDGNYGIYFAEGDIRHYVGYGRNGLNQRAFTQTLVPFNHINNVIELRQHEGDGEPHAAILRYYTDSGMGEENSKGEVLVVTKLDGDEACHVAYIDARANPDPNELARDAADRSEGFNCQSDDPEVIGKTGVSPM